jgi:hypothetical protein
MDNNLLTCLIGQRISLPRYFDISVVLEDARPLASDDLAGYEWRVRLPDGSLEEALISAEAAAVLGTGPGEGKAETPQDAQKLRLLIESARVHLAYAHDWQSAVSLSGIRVLPSSEVGIRNPHHEIADEATGGASSRKSKSRDAGGYSPSGLPRTNDTRPN